MNSSTFGRSVPRTFPPTVQTIDNAMYISKIFLWSMSLGGKSSLSRSSCARQSSVTGQGRGQPPGRDQKPPFVVLRVIQNPQALCRTAHQ